MPKGVWITRAAKPLVCRNVGIVKDVEDYIARAFKAFATKFKDQLSQGVLASMRALFNIDDELEMEMEEALLAHSGNDALDHDIAQDGAVVAAVLVT
ncbi:hypothetical protein ZWY2020_040080 [Hordeum vulgare]|nr:hypothetical protein ZWY2020_040080 [Hordeum vulgare]